MYSNCCCSCSFEPEIIKIGQSSHTMYSNKIFHFQVSTTILNACTKKTGNLLNSPYIYIYIYIYIYTKLIGKINNLYFKTHYHMKTDMHKISTHTFTHTKKKFTAREIRNNANTHTHTHTHTHNKKRIKYRRQMRGKVD